MRLEINEVEEPSNYVQSKINGAHHVSFDDVLDACEAYEKASLEHDEARGTRLLLRAKVRGRTVRIVLFPIDLNHGTWRLGTAFYV